MPTLDDGVDGSQVFHVTLHLLPFNTMLFDAFSQHLVLLGRPLCQIISHTPRLYNRNEVVHYLVQMAQIYILYNSISNHFPFAEGLAGREVKVDVDCNDSEHSQNGKADEFRTHHVSQLFLAAQLILRAVYYLYDLIRLLIDPLCLPLQHLLVALLGQHYQVQQLHAPSQANPSCKVLACCVDKAEGVQRLLGGQFIESHVLKGLSYSTGDRVSPLVILLVPDVQDIGAVVERLYLDCVFLVTCQVGQGLLSTWQKHLCYSQPRVNFSLIDTAAIISVRQKRIFFIYN